VEAPVFFNETFKVSENMRKSKAFLGWRMKVCYWHNTQDRAQLPQVFWAERYEKMLRLNQRAREIQKY